MNSIETFEQYLATNTANISIFYLVSGLLLAALMAVILKRIYIKYGTSLSNREKFAGNFLLLTTTTTLIITVVKSSLALSLGLVGALSIVRFRAAIKEPEELAFLFLAIGVGLGFGANQFIITIISFIVICGLIIIKSIFRKEEKKQNLNLSVTSKRSGKATLNNITNILTKHCSSVHLKRFDVTNDLIETSFFVTFTSFSKLSRVKKELESLSSSIRLTYLDRE
ncbi:DUF4956 domain-containing protein [candidate division KSB1 bacterium]